MAGPAGRMMAGGGPDQRSMDFKNSGKRLLAQFKPERITMYGLLLAVVLSVGLSVVGPKILGHATDLIFSGIVGKDMEAGQTKAEVLAKMREHGQGKMADMLSGMDFTPARASTSTRSARCCCSRSRSSWWRAC